MLCREERDRFQHISCLQATVVTDTEVELTNGMQLTMVDGKGII